MAMKPVKFDDYLKWFDEHKVVVKAQTSNGVKFKTTKATAKKLLDQVKTTTSTAVEATQNQLCVVENHFGTGSKSSQKEVQVNSHEQAIIDAEDYERLFEYFVNDDGVVMIKCDGFVIGPAVALEWEKEIEEDILDAEWENVADGGEGGAEHWDCL